MSNKSIAQLLNKLPETFTCLTIKNMPLMNLPTPCRRRNVTSAVKQRRRNHPGDLPFFVVAALDANYAAKSKFHDFIFFAACDEEGDEFAEKREVADDHQVAAGLFERFFRCCDLVLGAKAFALYQTIPRALSLCQMASTASFNGRKKSATFCTSPIPLSVNLRCGSSSSDFDSPC